MQTPPALVYARWENFAMFWKTKTVPENFFAFMTIHGSLFIEMEACFDKVVIVKLLHGMQCKCKKPIVDALIILHKYYVNAESFLTINMYFIFFTVPIRPLFKFDQKLWSGSMFESFQGRPIHFML